jgi:hypothetical protein
VATDDLAVAVQRAVERAVTGSFVLPGVLVSGGDIAAAIGAALGRPVRWRTVSPEEYADLLRPYVGDHAADGTAAVYHAIAGQPPGPAPDPTPAREALGWEPRDLATWASRVPALTLAASTATTSTGTASAGNRA